MINHPTQEFWNYICESRAKGDDYNYVSLSTDRKGRFLIKDRDEFINRYSNLIKENKNSYVSIAEKNNSEYSYLLIDIDLIVDAPEEEIVKVKEPESTIRLPSNILEPSSGMNKLYTYEEVECLIRHINKVLGDCIKDYKEKYSKCILLEKTAPYISGTRIKGGFHLHYPNIFLRKCDIKAAIFPKILKSLQSADFRFDNVNSDESEYFDIATVDVVWLLYGSSKTPKSGAYKFTKAYKLNSKEINIQEAFSDTVITNYRDNSIITFTGNEEYYLPRLLSIVRSSPVLELKFGVSCIEECEIDTASDIKNSFPNINVQDSLVIVKDLLTLISDSRADTYDSWYKIIAIIHGVTKGCKEGLELAIEFSKRTSKHNYDESKCISIWKTIKSDKYTIGSLKWAAKQDNPTAYANWNNASIFKTVSNSISGTHYGVAKILHNLYGEVYTCSKYSKKTWFEFKNHIWREVEEGVTLRNKLSEDIKKEMTKILAARKKEKALEQAETEGGEQEIKKDIVVTSLNKLIKDLENTGFKSSVMTEAKELFLDSDFENKLDTNINLMGFTNGILDMGTLKFREGNPTDYVSLCTGYDFPTHFTWDSDEVIEVLDFLKKIFPDESLYVYALEYCASLLKGGNFRKTFVTFTGSGDNGKTKFVDLIKNTLGQYSVVIPVSAITASTRAQSNGTNSEIVRTVGVRWAHSNEPNFGDRINVGVLKEFTGNDDIYIRALYGAGREYKPQFKYALICNKLPGLSCQDEAHWNRINVLPCESRFPRDNSLVPSTLEEQFRQKIFPRDETLDDRIKTFNKGFIWILFETFKAVTARGYTPAPEKVNSATEFYKKANDIYLQFFDEHIIQDPVASVSAGEVYALFTTWHNTSFPGRKLDSKPDFEMCMSSKLGELSKIRRWANFRIRKPEDNDHIEL